MSQFRVFVAILLAVIAAPAVAHADPISAAGLAISASLYSATGIYVSAATASFIVGSSLLQVTPFSRLRQFGRSDDR